MAQYFYIMKTLTICMLSLTLFSACPVQVAQKQTQRSMEQTSSVVTPAEWNPDSVEVATLGGGCFWCLEAVYQEMKGVLKVESGYAGGHVQHPTYREVCTGTTGHAEVVQITYDPQVTSYADILEVFFTIHDPTTLNRQGNDVGPQYRSIILYHNPEQKKIAQAAKEAAAQLWTKPIVTEIVPLDRFYKAEDYHQNYYRSNPSQPYCIYVVGPKVDKFREKFRDRLKQ